MLRILDSDMTIMIPTENVNSVGLRRIIGKDMVTKVYKILRDKKVEIDQQTWNRRYREYTEKIKTGSVLEIAKVLRDLFVLKGDKELSFGERKMLDTARNLLVKELAIAKSHQRREDHGGAAHASSRTEASHGPVSACLAEARGRGIDPPAPRVSGAERVVQAAAAEALQVERDAAEAERAQRRRRRRRAAPGRAGAACRPRGTSMRASVVVEAHAQLAEAVRRGASARRRRPARSRSAVIARAVREARREARARGPVPGAAGRARGWRRGCRPW